MELKMGINELYDELQNNVDFMLTKELKRHWEMVKDGESRYFVPTRNLSLSDDKKYIHYQYFGSSAVKNRIESLKWLLTTIFECTAEDFTPCTYYGMCDFITDMLYDNN